MYEDFNVFPLIRVIREESVANIAKFLEQNYKEYAVKANGEQNKQIEIFDKHTLATPLFYVAARATDEESVEVAKLLVEKYNLCKADTKDVMKQNCLFYAAREGHIQLCKYLIEKGCQPNDADNFGQNCLFYASREGRTECVKYLIDKGANPNLLDYNKQTCLFYACRDGRYDTVKCLLENGVNPQIKDTQRRTAMTFAKGNGHVNIMHLLKNASVSNRGSVDSLQQFGSQTIFKKGGSSPNITGTLYNEGNSNNIGVSLKENVTSNAKKESVGNVHTVGHVHLNESSFSDQQSQRISFVCSESQPPRDTCNLIHMHLNDTNIFFADSGVRKKYKLQYRPLDDDPILWLDAPLIKINEFERKFPKLAVWPKDAASFINTEVNNMNNLFTKQWYASANYLIQCLSKYEGGHIFEKLVDPKKQNCPDYYDVIKNPMSFSCIKSKLKKGQYKSPNEFISDVELIFYNCSLYNSSNSLVAITGKNIETYFNNQLIVTGFTHFVAKENKINEILKKVEEENNLWLEEQKQKGEVH